MIGASHPGRLMAARATLAVVLAAHGAAHFVAVARLVRSISLDLRVELFGGLVVTSSPAAALVVALALATAGTGFVAAAGMLVGREPKLGPLLVAVLSLLTTVLGLWGTVGGVLVNLGLLAVAPAIPTLVAPSGYPPPGDRRPAVEEGPPALAGLRATS